MCSAACCHLSLDRCRLSLDLRWRRLVLATPRVLSCLSRGHLGQVLTELRACGHPRGVLSRLSPVPPKTQLLVPLGVQCLS